MKYRKKDGTIAERGLVSRQGIKKSDFRKLLEAVLSVNPDIKIDQDLIGE